MLKKKTSQRGSALMLVVIVVMILTGISVAYATVSWWNYRRASQEEAAAQALYIVEGGAAQYLAKLNAQKLTQPPAQDQTSFGGGSYWVPLENIVNFGDPNVVGASNVDADYWSFQLAAKYNGVTRRVTVLVSHVQDSPWGAQVWAGNKRKNPKTGLWEQIDPNYTLDFGGDASTGANDKINGKVYSGGNINVGPDAKIMDVTGKNPGEVQFVGTNKGSNTDPTYKKGEQDGLEIARDGSGKLDAQINAAKIKADPTSYPDGRIDGVAWVDVAQEFKSSGIANNKWGPDGSVATDLPQSNPAHFIRQNPTSTNGSSNRTQSYERSVNTTTVKTSSGVQRNDYYLEDPYNKSVTQPSLSGVPVNGDTTASMLNIPKESNNAVYFIDGNMRISGENVKSYQLNPSGHTDALKMTFIVKGNISLTDNLLYPNWESKKDVVAMIATADPDWPNTSQYDFNGAADMSLPPGGHPNGPSIKSFVDSYNTRAANSGGAMAPLSLPNDAARASQEYNKIYGSGNIFFGDPGSGTVEHFESFMYAENNFYATNLDAMKSNGGTSKVEVYGNMTAAGEVLMDRTSSKAGYNGYIPLVVHANMAMASGNKPPGVPEPPSKPGVDWNVKSWRLATTTAELKSTMEK